MGPDVSFKKCLLKPLIFSVMYICVRGIKIAPIFTMFRLFFPRPYAVVFLFVLIALFLCFFLVFFYSFLCLYYLWRNQKKSQHKSKTKTDSIQKSISRPAYTNKSTNPHRLHNYICTYNLYHQYMNSGAQIVLLGMSIVCSYTSPSNWTTMLSIKNSYMRMISTYIYY